MSLSSSTLSLKFMQRGKAPAGNATPSKNTNKAGQHPTPSASAGPSTSNSPAPASLITPNSTDRPEEVSQTLAREEAAKWYIPRPNKPATAGAAPKKGDVRVEYEASYAPFLPGFDDQDSDEEDEDAGERTAGGGRMVFGGFGKPKGKEKAEDGDDEDAAMDSEEEEVQDKRAKPRVEKRKSFAKDKREQKVPAQQPPKTFLRPAMSPPPSNPKSSSSRPKSSTQSVSSLKQEPNTALSSKKHKASKRPAPPESPQTSFTGSGAGVKKAKIEPEGGKQKVKKEKSGGGGSLDDREKMMKAQKKAEKRRAKEVKGL
ncbi:hypothetical protein L198_04440 [Cryptococcus wingfieldii CBS 7118]|uniref:Uncharacterized protein n=1 Tax=Cryptococcus wingfieldii CBS 7118 TaxID=1295528 RepID=A0A1E3J4P5_9TREE|nr:hypothetical protein L198_04440 [Cryptococcus wingfieldii CBS 7118]ODN95822.1 hypothetical protein L198_04440 [Cryptococcus wingfieldii CBS 7118]